ncbi:MAG: hypothetical protein ACYDHY_09450 [Acidiferrobacterales bacterium]
MGRGVASYEGCETVFIFNDAVYGEYLHGKKRHTNVENGDYDSGRRNFEEDIQDLLSGKFRPVRHGTWDMSLKGWIIAESSLYQVLMTDEDVLFGLHLRIRPDVVQDRSDSDRDSKSIEAEIRKLAAIDVARRGIDGGPSDPTQPMLEEISALKKLKSAVEGFSVAARHTFNTLAEFYPLRVRKGAWMTAPYPATREVA